LTNINGNKNSAPPENWLKSIKSGRQRIFFDSLAAFL